MEPTIYGFILADHEKHNEVLELTKQLITFASTNSRPEELSNCATFIRHWLDENDISYWYHAEGPIPSIAVLPQPGYAPVLLMTHFDVVEAEDQELFTPKVIDGNLYGRGSIDDKYGVALSMVLFREYLKKAKASGKSQNEVPFGILLTGDEEVGGGNGAKKFAEKITTDFFLAIDGGNPNLIVTKEKGIISLEFTAQGEAAHAARPWLGRSAFDILVDDYARIKTLFSGESEDHWHRTMVLTKCSAGNGSPNIVPELARAVCDIRFTESDDPDELINTIKDLTASKVTVHAKEPIFMSQHSPYLDLLLDHSGGASVGFEHGASDARYFSTRNISGAIWGAEGEMSQHSKQEHIVISSLYQLYDRLDSFLSSLPQPQQG